MDVSLATKSKLKVTFDSGTTYMTLNENRHLLADSLYSYEFGVTNGDTFNVQSVKTSNVNRCLVCIVGQQP